MGLTWEGLVGAFMASFAWIIGIWALLTFSIGGVLYVFITGIQALREAPIPEFWPFMAATAVGVAVLALAANSRA